MLNITFKHHRGGLKADSPDAQKLYAMLKLIPKQDVAKARPPLAFALVVDTSSSMQEYADQKAAENIVKGQGLETKEKSADNKTVQKVELSIATKMDQAIEAAHALVNDARLAATDKIAVVHFDDEAKVLLPLTPVSGKDDIHKAIDSLRQQSGGTHMGDGLKCALDALSDVPPETCKRVIVLTDGQTFDEEECREAVTGMSERNAPIIGIGIGHEYNEQLVLDLTQGTQGRPYHLKTMDQLGEILSAEVGSSVKEVVTDLQLSVSAAKGVTIDSISRVYPSLAEVTVTKPYRLGNVAAGDYTVYIMEFSVTGMARPAGKARLAQVGLSGHAPALGRKDEFPPQELSVEFTTDEAKVAAVDSEVLGYVQQKNIDRMMQDAARQASTDPNAARKTLQMAVNMTQKVGNAGATQILNNALTELNKTGTISPETRKTVAVGGRTKTIRAGEATMPSNMPKPEDIRKMTGA
jgi:Ca-activated chloride channel family protein